MSPLLSYGAGGKGFYSLDAGAYCTNVDKRISLSSDLASAASSFYGYFRTRGGIHLGKDFFIEPSMLFVLPWQKGADGTTKTFYGHFALDLGVPIKSFLALRLGAGIHSSLLLATAESVQLQNGGSGTFSTFHVPGASLFTFTFAFQTTLEIHFSKVISLNLDLYAMDPLSSTRRNFDAAVGLGVKL